MSVCESDIVNRSCGRHSLGARPLGHSMRAVRESTARKRRIIATEQSPVKVCEDVTGSPQESPTTIALQAVLREVQQLREE